MQGRANAVVLLMVLLAGCTSQVQPPQAGFAAPQVIQRNHAPVNWVQFKPTTTGRDYQGIANGPDGNLWFTDYSGSGLVRITMSGSAKEFPLPSGAAPYMVTAGADNNLYVTDVPFDRILQVSQAGIVKSFPIPSGDFPEGGMTKAPDGNVWFVESKHIAKVTPAGVITEFAYPSGAVNQANGGATVGPDKKVWFAESGAGIIGKIDTTTNAITEYTTTTSPVGSCYITGIITAKDHNLYFTCTANQNSSTGYLGKISTSGSQIYYADPYGFSLYPQDLAVGSDGGVWFDGDQFTQTLICDFDISTHGITTHSFPDFSYQANVIVAARDGNVWGVDSSPPSVDVYVIDVLDVTPNSLTFPMVGQQQTLTVTENGAGSWTARSSKTSVATVAPGGSGNTFVVTSVAAGSAKITIKDPKGNLFPVSVVVQ